MKTASISETRQKLSSLLNWIKNSQNDVVIQNRGQAEAVIIPIADYELLQEARERRRRQQAVDELRQIAQEVNARNNRTKCRKPRLTQDEAQEIADAITDEAINNLVNKGQVIFQE